VAVLATLLATRSDDSGGHGNVLAPTAALSSPGPRSTAKNLSHTAVEIYIANDLGASNVQCNHGEDFPMKHNGDSFTCTAAGGKSFKVTIESTEDGSYLVQ
jgi:hypothetical protein